MMPDIDGYEVYRRLRLDGRTRNIPIIFVTAKARREQVEQGLALGAEGYVCKPFEPSELIEAVDEVLGEE